MYDTIRTRAYSVKLSEGIPATVMYMVLIYFLIRFLFIYIKRYFTVNILALMGPIMAIKYAFDKINTGKSGSLGAWMYDFALNVLLQSVHAIIYTIFMAMAFELGMESIPGFLLALCILNFVFKAEKIFMQIFKFDDRAKSIKDVDENKNYFLEAYKVTRGIGLFSVAAAKFGFGAVKNTTKFVGGVGIFSAQVATSTVRRGMWIKDKIRAKQNGLEQPTYQALDVEEKMKETLKKVKGKTLNLADDGLYKLTGVRSLRLGLNKMKEQDPVLYDSTKSLLDKNKKLKHQVMKRNISGSIKSIKTMASLAISVPMMVVDPESGFTMFATTLGDIKDATDGKTHYGHRTKKEIRGRRGRIAAVALTGVAGFAYNSAKDSYEQLGKDKKKVAKNEAMLGDLRTAYVLESDLEKEIEKINKQLEEDKKALDEKQKESIEKEVQSGKEDAIEQALDSILGGRNIKGAINDYMVKNGTTKLTSSDIESLLREFNLEHIDKEISKLKGVKPEAIDRLKKKAEKLKEVIKDGMEEANNSNEIKKAQEELEKMERKIERSEMAQKVGQEMIQKVGEAISKDGNLGEGIFKNKDDVGDTIVEYMKDKKIDKLKDSDVQQIVTMFNEKVKNKNIETHATKEGIKEQFKKQDKEGKGLDKKKSVNAILDSNFKEGSKNVKVEGKYETLSDRLRELQILNQKSINTNGKSVVDIRKIIEKIKK